MIKMNFIHFAFLAFCLFATAPNTLAADKPIRAGAYSKLLKMRHNDHRALIERMLSHEYSKNYKLLSVALEKIFHVIEQSNKTLIEDDYSPITDGFVVEHSVQEAVTMIIEDTCLAAEIILHFPEMSRKILKKTPNWKQKLNWCLDFIKQYPKILGKQILELIDLTIQEINEDLRSPDFVNPYYKQPETEEAPTKKPKKEAKKIKKGPQLTTTKTEL